MYVYVIYEEDRIKELTTDFIPIPFAEFDLEESPRIGEKLVLGYDEDNETDNYQVVDIRRKIRFGRGGKWQSPMVEVVVKPIKYEGK